MQIPGRIRRTEPPTTPCSPCHPGKNGGLFSPLGGPWYLSQKLPPSPAGPITTLDFNADEEANSNEEVCQSVVWSANDHEELDHGQLAEQHGELCTIATKTVSKDLSESPTGSEPHHHRVESTCPESDPKDAQHASSNQDVDEASTESASPENLQHVTASIASPEKEIAGCESLESPCSEVNEHLQGRQARNADEGGPQRHDLGEGEPDRDCQECPDGLLSSEPICGNVELRSATDASEIAASVREAEMQASKAQYELLQTQEKQEELELRLRASENETQEEFWRAKMKVCIASRCLACGIHMRMRLSFLSLAPNLCSCFHVDSPARPSHKRKKAPRVLKDMVSNGCRRLKMRMLKSVGK